MIKVGSDFSGVGAFDQALMRLGVDYETVFACDMDKYARYTFIHNYGEPKYYPVNVYDREIPSESLDIYMTSPPCQAFSLAGKRLGKDDKRGILFFNSHEFIKENKPRYFIFENVKGLLSDDNGNTFQEWVNMLGGKSVNGVPILFPYEDSVPYHIYWKVLNAKKYGVPQNRERVFIIGIRDEEDNIFQFPKEEHLTKRLKDVLEDEVDEKYFLSENTIEKLIEYDIKQKENGNGFGAKFHDTDGMMSALKVGGGGCDDLIKIKSATSKGYETATENDSINFSVPNSETRRGRVGKGVAQTLDTQCNQGVWIGDYRADEGLRIRKDGVSPCMTSSMRDTEEWKANAGTRNPPLVGLKCIPVLTPNRMEKRQNGRRFKEDREPAFTVTCQDQHGIYDGYKIRRLTPRECFRLMDFPDSFTWPVSDSQAYKQAGNSIVVGVLEKIISKLKL
jgi:DNA (cytosine-5)-methyltransferase 1